MRRAWLLMLCVCSVGLTLAHSASAADNAAKDQDEAQLAYVTVAGAPGDGEQALTKALYDALAAQGVKQANFNDTHVYEIEGIVRVEADAGGKQSVKINWIVFDADGNTLGHVAQTKSVRKGSLDKAWGPAAKAAAGAAVGEIMELLQQR